MSQFQLPGNIRYSFLLLNSVFLVSGAVAIGTMVYFLLQPFARRNVVLTSDIVTGALACGCITTVIAVLGYIGYAKALSRSMVMVCYCWLAGLLQIGEIILGAFVWFRTLDIRSDYYPKWQSWSEELRQNFQDFSRCCGYFNATDFAAPSDQCPSTVSLDGSDASTKPLTGCSEDLQIYAADYLQDMYTVIFCFVVIAFIAMFAGILLYLSCRDLKRYMRTTEKLVRLRSDA
ncbi:hypothetical protein H4R35_003710 [Dimargaris xerosporica]|nr:hypothetical protein H4R35_003710 [Dimargaris xerosporica]